MPPADPERVEGSVGPGLDGDRLLARYRTMARIRAFEERVAVRFREGDIPGFVHISLGQEAVAAGACATLRREDVVTTTHRGHGHSLAKGIDPVAMMAELFGRATGVCRGKGGSMHIADPGAGVLGANGIVGAGIPLAVGAALSAATLETGTVSVAFFGEGAVHCGAFHEGVTLAMRWSVPTVLICENNLYSEFTDSRSIPGPSPADRAASYGLLAEVVDGNDVLAVEDAVARAVRGAREGAGPAFVEATTYRFSGHYEGDPEVYRPREEVEEWRRRDPLLRARRTLEEAGLGETAAQIDCEAGREMDGAVELAQSAPFPEPDTVLESVFAA